LIKTYFKEDVPESVLGSPGHTKGLIYTNDDGKEYRYEQPTLNVWRSSFDFWLADKAVSAGAELRDETAAISCEERSNDVIVKLRGKTEYTEKAKIVIACDGAAGTIKQKLAHMHHEHIFTYQTFNKGSVELDPQYFYAYLQPDLAEYNAWFNVKDDYLIFGVAGKHMGKIDQYYSAFMHYMKSRHNARIDAQERYEKWTMPRIVPGCPVDYGKGRVMFAGETAGFLNPMGEGISAALECGFAAADAIEKAGNFDMKAIYAAYKNNVSGLKAYMERQWRLIGSMSDKFAHMK
jgi:flavin-dependent dehydrogenase